MDNTHPREQENQRALMKQKSNSKAIEKMKYPAPAVQGQSILASHKVQMTYEDRKNFLENVVLTT